MNDLGTKIKEALGEYWDERAVTAVEDPTCMDDLLPPMDSLTAVEVLVILDKIVGSEVPETVIQNGGYHTREEFIEVLSSSVLEQMKASQS